MTSKQPKVWITLILILGFIAMLLGAFAYKHYKPEAKLHELDATVLTQSRTVKPFTLTDENGKPYTNQQLKGHWTFVYFGYTSCPDICPTTLAVLNQMYGKLLQTKTANPDVLFVSVDPHRDSPKHLKEYIKYFNGKFMAATGSHKQIQALTKELGIAYRIVPEKGKTEKNPGDTYLVDHSGAVLLFNPQGRLHAIFTQPDNAENMANEFLVIKKYAEK
tara:strand:- start:57549 stop:58205 length:657 start_codon:yes stop_codon:yes gene_type:complete